MSLAPALDRPRYNPLPYLDQQRLDDPTELRLGKLHVRDPRLWPFLAVVLGEPGLAVASSSDGMRIRVSPSLEPWPITRRDSDEPVIEICKNSGQPLREPSRPECLPLIRKGNWWIASFILRHPHAWDLIDGAAPRDVKRLALSVANSGVAKVVDAQYLAECLLALLPAEATPDVADEVHHICRSARAKQGGLALFRDVSYDPWDIGPLPLGHTRRGHFALLDRRRGRVVLAHADQILSQQYLEMLAPLSFWMTQYGWRRRLNASWAGEALVLECFKRGRYEADGRTLATVTGRGG